MEWQWPWGADAQKCDGQRTHARLKGYTAWGCRQRLSEATLKSHRNLCSQLVVGKLLKLGYCLSVQVSILGNHDAGKGAE